jgi:hypothetical protein
VYYALRGLAAVGIVKDLKTPPRSVRDARPEPGALDAGLVRASLERARWQASASTEPYVAGIDAPVATAIERTDDVIRRNHARR